MKPVCMLKNYKQHVPSQYGASHSNNLWFFNGIPIHWQHKLKEIENLLDQAIPSSSTLFKINPLHHAQHAIVDTLQINSQSDRRLKGNTNVNLRLLNLTLFNAVLAITSVKKILLKTYFCMVYLTQSLRHHLMKRTYYVQKWKEKPSIQTSIKHSGPSKEGLPIADVTGYHTWKLKS